MRCASGKKRATLAGFVTNVILAYFFVRPRRARFKSSEFFGMPIANTSRLCTSTMKITSNTRSHQKKSTDCQEKNTEKDSVADNNPRTFLVVVSTEKYRTGSAYVARTLRNKFHLLVAPGHLDCVAGVWLCVFFLLMINTDSQKNNFFFFGWCAAASLYRSLVRAVVVCL